MRSKQAKTNIAVVLGVLALLIIAAAMGYSAFGKGTVTQTTIGGATGATGASSAGCPVNPTVVSAVTDTLTPGTSITTTNSYRINGVYTGTTAPTTVGTADILFNASGYIANIKTGVPINCNANLVTNNLYARANATLTYYSTNGLNSLTLSTINETVMSAGGSYNWKIHLQGTDKKSTGKQLFVVELSVPANVSSVSMSNGAQEVAVPNGYARQLTNSYAKAFLLPAVVGNTAVDYNLAVAASTSTIVSGLVYTTIYNVEPFVETDGSFSDIGAAFNSVNTAKWADRQTKNFYAV